MNRHAIFEKSSLHGPFIASLQNIDRSGETYSGAPFLLSFQYFPSN